MRRLLVTLFIGLSGFLFIGLFASPSYAQEKNNFSLSISPSILEIQAKIPSAPSANINIENKSDKDITLGISIRAFRQEGDSGEITYLSPNESKAALESVINNVKILDGDTQVNTVKLSALESKTLNLKIDLNKNVKPADYYFTVLFTGQIDNQDTTLSTSGGIGTDVILSISGKEATIGHIEEFSTPFFTTSGPIPFKLLFSNDSNHYVIPRGHISINNLFGGYIGRVDILPQYILANSERFLTDSKQIGSQDKSVIWPEKFLMGIYTANLVIRMSDSGPTYSRTIIFMSFPLLIIFIFSIIAFFTCSVVYKIVKRIRNS